MGMENWQKLLLVVGGTATAGTLLYLLFRDETEGESATSDRATTVAGASGGLSKRELIEVVKELANSQNETSSRLKNLAQSMASGPELSFDELYNKLKASEPVDPLERRGLSMADLDGPLQQHMNDPEVGMAMQIMMTGGAQDLPTGGPNPSLTIEKLTEINVFMVENLQNFIQMFNKLEGREKYDLKIIMNCLQASSDSKLFAKYGYSTDDLQAATQAKQQELSKNKDFISSQEEMHAMMEVFVKQLQALKASTA